MADDKAPAERGLRGSDDPERTMVVTPAAGEPIVEDTGRPEGDSRTNASFRSVNTKDLPDRSLVVVVEERKETKVHMGPLPDPQTLKEYAAIYPNAPRIIFEEFKAQSAHRRELEKQGMATGSLLATRGQFLAAGLGGIGLVVSGVVAGMGQSLAGFGMAVLSIGTLAGLFVYGQERQKKELQDKQKTRKKIDDGTSIEELEKNNESPRP